MIKRSCILAIMLLAGLQGSASAKRVLKIFVGEDAVVVGGPEPIAIVTGDYGVYNEDDNGGEDNGVAATNDYGDYGAEETGPVYQGVEIDACRGLINSTCCPTSTPINGQPGETCNFTFTAPPDVVQRLALKKTQWTVNLELVQTRNQIWYDNKDFFCFCDTKPEEGESSYGGGDNTGLYNQGTAVGVNAGEDHTGGGDTGGGAYAGK